MRLLSLIIIGSLSYYAYTNYSQMNQKSKMGSSTDGLTIDSKDLPKFQNIDHDKSNNLLYNPATDTNIKIVHHFSSQVMPHSYNYAIM